MLEWTSESECFERFKNEFFFQIYIPRPRGITLPLAAHARHKVIIAEAPPCGDALPNYSDKAQL